MIYKNLSFSEYKKLPGISRSTLIHALKSDKHLKAAIDGKLIEESEALSFGEMVHQALLLPEHFSKNYVCWNGKIKRGKEWDEFEAANQNKSILTPKQLDQINGILNAILNNSLSSRLLKLGAPEISLCATLDGVECKARLDYIREDGLVIDLKTTESASYNDFSRSIAKYNYHVQAAFYLDLARACGLKADTFLFLAVEKSFPYCSAVYELHDVAIEKGREVYKELLLKYKTCLSKNEWIGYPEDVQLISVPDWAL
jgi:exodeoxyribonuclease VIII